MNQEWNVGKQVESEKVRKPVGDDDAEVEVSADARRGHMHDQVNLMLDAVHPTPEEAGYGHGV